MGRTLLKKKAKKRDKRLEKKKKVFDTADNSGKKRGY